MFVVFVIVNIGRVSEVVVHQVRQIYSVTSNQRVVHRETLELLNQLFGVSYEKDCI